MGTSTNYHGQLTIEPPLSWPEIQKTEAWSGHPDHFAAAYLARIRHGACLIVDEAPVDTPEGTLIRRFAAEVQIVGDELSHDGVMDGLRALARQFGATHRFDGTLDCRHDHPDVETPFRVRIVGTTVEEVWPVMFWPDDPEVYGRIRATLGQHSGVEPDDADDIAARVLGTLVANYTKEG